MISWIVIGLLLICGIVVIELTHLHHKLWVFLLILLVIFLYFSFVTVNNSDNFDLDSPEGIMGSGKVYLSWLANGFNNVKSLAGRAIEMDWRLNESLNDSGVGE